MSTSMDDRLKNQLKELSEMKDGWHDGEGLAPSSESIEMAERFLKALTSKIYLYPTLDGGVNIEWGCKDLGVEVEVGSNGGEYDLELLVVEYKE